MTGTRFTRKTVDLTEAQARALEEMIAATEKRISEAAGIPIALGVRQFFHLLLKRYAEELGIEWPEDYPTPGGWRGGPKDGD